MDVAFRVTAAGKLDFAKDERGEFYLDDREVYAVLATIQAHKKEYAWSSTLGTYLHTIKKDGLVTGTRIKAALADAGAQLVSAGLIHSFDGASQRLATGIWQLLPTWSPIYGRQTKERFFL